MEEKKKLTILGLGNILLQDEGFGVHFVRYISERYRFPEGVEIIDGGVLGYTLLDILGSCEEMIVVDCLKVDDAPGSIYRFTREEMDMHLPPPTSAHEVKFADVLCKSEMMGECPEMIFLCIVPQDYQDMNLEMTPIIKEKIPVMEKLLLEELASREIFPEPVVHA
jgi:hydrogenase maturation protease